LKDRLQLKETSIFQDIALVLKDLVILVPQLITQLLEAHSLWVQEEVSTVTSFMEQLLETQGLFIVEVKCPKEIRLHCLINSSLMPLQLL